VLNYADGNIISTNTINYCVVGVVLHLTRNSLSENVVDANTYGIEIDGDSVNHANKNELVGNTVNQNRIFNIYLHDGASFNTITGNDASDGSNAYSGSYASILLNGYCSNNTISNNILVDYEYAGNTQNSSVELRDNSYGNIISGNQATGNLGYAITLDATSINNTIKNNNLEGVLGGIGPVPFTATGLIISGNRGFATGADYQEIWVPYNGKIADITHPDTGKHTLDLATALTETRTIIGIWVGFPRISGTGYIAFYPNNGTNYIANAGTGTIKGEYFVLILPGSQTLDYSLTVANDDFDLYCWGYEVRVSTFEYIPP
jgi:parallel beta-helix repeat protein